MAKTIKTCDLPIATAAALFCHLNGKKISIRSTSINNPWHSFVLVTDTEPSDLVYPEGWYYAKGCFRNKHTSTTGIYEEMYMFHSDGEPWEAPYSTLE